MFGFGMVLASGCGNKTLVRIGGGSLKSLVVFIVLGLAAFATLKGITAVLRVATVDRGRAHAAGAAGPAVAACRTARPGASARSRSGSASCSVARLLAWALARPEGRVARQPARPASASAR